MAGQGGRAELRRGAELFGLCGLVVAQPLYAVFGDAPEVFVFADASRAEIVGFALLVLLVPPLVLWGVGALVRLVSPAARDWVHAASVAALIGVLAAELLKHLEWLHGWWLVPIAAAAAIGAGVLYRRWPPLPVLLRYLAVGGVLFLVSFLGFSPTGELLRPDGVEAVALDVADADALPPVVMIVFDEWPLTSIVDGDGQIDAVRYPNLARLAGDATWYRNTTTVSNSTLYAVPALLTGRMPEEDRSADARSHPENLFTLLGGSYRLEAVEPVTRLCPEALCHEPTVPDAGETSASGPSDGLVSIVHDARRVLWGLVSPVATTPVSTALEEREVDTRTVDVDAGVADANEDRSDVDLDVLDAPRPQGLAGLLRTFRADEAPTVHFLHLLVPHTPYSHLSTGERYTEDEGIREVAPVDGGPGADRRGSASWPAELDRQRMLHQVAYLDSLVGDLLDRLERSGLYDDALVVVTADHGLAFEPGAPARGLGPDPVPDAAVPDLGWVPLFVKAPGQTAGVVDDRNALTIDVLPTIADLLEIQMPPWDLDGRSLVGEPRDTDRKPFLRAAGSAFATYDFDPPVDLSHRADLEDVFDRGVDGFLGVDTGPASWYRAGPQAQLVGRSLSSLSLVPATRQSAHVDDLGALLDVTPGDPLPSLLTGRIAEAPDDEVVAIVLNGRVAAVVPTYTDEGGPGRVAGLLLRSAFRSGVNRVQLFRVANTTTGPVLAPIAVTG